MKSTKHRDGSISLKLTACEAAALWGLVREGRRAHVKEYAAYDSTWALNLMTVLSPDTKYVDPNYVKDHMRRFG